MAIPYSIFPIQLPGQSFVQPAQPIRGGPSWNVKQTAKWSNHKYRAINGRSVVYKYWNNALWDWEFVYEQLFNDPSQPNAYYAAPIPGTDLEILQSFYNDMQGQGNVFAYLPADSVDLRGCGGNIVSQLFDITVPNYATFNDASPSQMRLGDLLTASDFVVASYLNGQTGTIVAINPQANTFTLHINTSGVHPGVSEIGVLTGGQPLSAPDANGNVELVHTIGSYPTTVSFIANTKLSTESVQLIDTSTLNVYAGTSPTFSYTLSPPNTVAGYQGYVLNFSSPPTLPLTARFRYFYPCRFSEDTQEYENFMTMLWSCSSVKITQERF